MSVGKPEHAADTITPQVPAESATPFDPFRQEREEFMVISEEAPGTSVDRIATDIADIAFAPSAFQNAPVFSENVDGRNDISRKLLAKIVSIAASEIAGIAPPRRDLWARIEDIIRGRVDGIRVDVGTAEAAVDISTSIQFGSDIPAITSMLRENIAKRIYEMTGLRVVEVNVIVRDVTRGDG